MCNYFIDDIESNNLMKSLENENVIFLKLVHKIDNGRYCNLILIVIKCLYFHFNVISTLKCEFCPSNDTVNKGIKVGGFYVNQKILLRLCRTVQNLKQNRMRIWPVQKFPVQSQCRGFARQTSTIIRIKSKFLIINAHSTVFKIESKPVILFKP
jgi:hypothetical protein